MSTETKSKTKKKTPGRTPAKPSAYPRAVNKIQAKCTTPDLIDFELKAKLYFGENMSAFIVEACRAYKPLKKSEKSWAV